MELGARVFNPPRQRRASSANVSTPRHYYRVRIPPKPLRLHRRRYAIGSDGDPTRRKLAPGVFGRPEHHLRTRLQIRPLGGRESHDRRVGRHDDVGSAVLVGHAQLRPDFASTVPLTVPLVIMLPVEVSIIVPLAGAAHGLGEHEHLERDLLALGAGFLSLCRHSCPA